MLNDITDEERRRAPTIPVYSLVISPCIHRTPSLLYRCSNLVSRLRVRCCGFEPSLVTAFCCEYVLMGGPMTFRSANHSLLVRVDLDFRSGMDGWGVCLFGLVLMLLLLYCIGLYLARNRVVGGYPGCVKRLSLIGFRDRRLAVVAGSVERTTYLTISPLAVLKIDTGLQYSDRQQYAREDPTDQSTMTRTSTNNILVEPPDA